MENLTSENRYCGVILAAGRGTRMQPFSERYPKPLLPICNKPLIVSQIEMMRALGISKIVVLIGYKGFEIAKVLGNGSQYGVQIQYVEQTSTLGIAHAVGLLEPYVDRPFLLFLGDIFFLPTDLKQMFQIFQEQDLGAVLATKQEREAAAVRKNFSLVLSPAGLVTRVIEKPRHTANLLKGVGIYLFDLVIFDAIRRTPRTAMRDEYELTESIQVMIEDGTLVRPANVIEEDINLTHPADLLLCNLVSARRSASHNVMGGNARLHPDAKIHNSVIGSNVTVQNPITIVHSMIFDDTCVDAQIGLEKMIVTPDGTVDCRYAAQLQQFGAVAKSAVMGSA